jgi:hypothetical protein
MLSKYLYLQSRLKYIIWRNILNHLIQFSASPFSFLLNLRPYCVSLILLFMPVCGRRRFTDPCPGMEMDEVRVNQETAIVSQSFFLNF